MFFNVQYNNTSNRVYGINILVSKEDNINKRIFSQASCNVAYHTFTYSFFILEIEFTLSTHISYHRSNVSVKI